MSSTHSLQSEKPPNYAEPGDSPGGGYTVAAESQPTSGSKRRKAAVPRKAPESSKHSSSFVPATSFSALINALARNHSPTFLVNDRAKGGALPPRQSFAASSTKKPKFELIRHSVNMSKEEKERAAAAVAQGHQEPQHHLGSDDTLPPGAQHSTGKSARGGGRGSNLRRKKTSPPTHTARSESAQGNGSGRKRARGATQNNTPDVSVEPASSTVSSGSAKTMTRTRSAARATSVEPASVVAASSAPNGGSTHASAQKRRKLDVHVPSAAIGRSVSASSGPTSPLAKELVSKHQGMVQV